MCNIELTTLARQSIKVHVLRTGKAKRLQVKKVNKIKKGESACFIWEETRDGERRTRFTCLRRSKFLDEED